MSNLTGKRIDGIEKPVTVIDVVARTQSLNIGESVLRVDTGHEE